MLRLTIWSVRSAEICLLLRADICEEVSEACWSEDRIVSCVVVNAETCAGARLATMSRDRAPN